MFMRSLVIHLLVLTCFQSFAILFAQSNEDVDYFRKWLMEDVLYIITPEEHDVFSKLQTDEEREHFIEQFWQRRDPDSRTAHNEFIEEHYRRIAYANESFASGIPGWKTDRGMIYIKFGPPDRINATPSGGHYDRPSWEGGGSTSTFPFERWEYRFIEGAGQDIEIEFVDRTLSGEYVLTTNPHEKDALLYVPGAGLTEAEALGLVRQKIDRIIQKTSPMPWNNPLLTGYGRLKDQPFEKLQLVTNLNRAPMIDFSDLRTDVASRVYYDQIPFDLRSDVFRGDSEAGRAIVTLSMQKTDLTFLEKETLYRGELEIYGVVKTLAGRIVQEIGDVLLADVSPREFKTGPTGSLVYQKDFRLLPGRYKLEFYVKDPSAEKLGSKQALILVPTPKQGSLQMSSVILARQVERLSENGEAFKVWPIVKDLVSLELGKLGFYYEIYNAAIDQSTLKPDLVLSYRIVNSEGDLLGLPHEFDSVDRRSDRVQVLSILSAVGLKSGPHRLVIHVEDRIAEQEFEESIPFRLE